MLYLFYVFKKQFLYNYVCNICGVINTFIYSLDDKKIFCVEKRIAVLRGIFHAESDAAFNIFLPYDHFHLLLLYFMFTLLKIRIMLRNFAYFPRNSLILVHFELLSSISL